jgi:hypothetical protein
MALRNPNFTQLCKLLYHCLQGCQCATCKLSFALVAAGHLTLQLCGQQLQPDGNVSLRTTQLQPACLQACTEKEFWNVAKSGAGALDNPHFPKPAVQALHYPFILECHTPDMFKEVSIDRAPMQAVSLSAA